MNKLDENQLGSEKLDKIKAELQRFTADEERKLGLSREQWAEPVFNKFTPEQREHTTILVSGLTLAHDQFCGAALRGLGLNVETLDCPDKGALQFGKEYGNRGQCNPTYFTVGNLIKHLTYLREQRNFSTRRIINQFIFLTAGACGPCRFGTYVSEYRKALRDAGFEGFRVLLFQQQGGIKQATGEGLGLEINLKFIHQIIRAMIAGDVINLMGYRIRPYEIVPGATNAALEQCKILVSNALELKKSPIPALRKSRLILAEVDFDPTVPKPVVSIIGEFWAMTTEGDGNYHLQDFLEREGAEVDIQGITNWLLFMIWENRHDTLERINLRNQDNSPKGLKGTRPKWKLFKLRVAEFMIRSTFKVYGNSVGLYSYDLPDMDEIASLAKKYYDTGVRGGEGHMEVGKLIHFINDQVNHMTISVKPFGCMPSSGVSDGVQSLVTTKWPESLFLPLETTGDGQVSAHSRIQMMLYKARQKVQIEFENAFKETGLSEADFYKFVHTNKTWKHTFRRPKHRTACNATNLVYTIGNL
jgi:predicted nucleotide-binding protein (sugar kinase/HSP70/actin superfamily)